MSQATVANPARLATHELSRKTTGGMVWLMAQTLSSKVASLLGQLILAKLLLPGEWGLVGLTYTVSTFVSTAQQLGVREILIHRQRKYRTWANASFWICVASGIVGAIVLASVAGYSAKLYHEPRLRGMLWVIAVAVLLNPLPTVPLALLQSQLRFRLISVLGTIDAVGLVVLSVAFAYCGAGAYSFILPRPIMNALRFVLAAWFARPPLRMRAQVRRWRYLMGDNVTLLVARIANTAISQGDYIMLGLFHPSRVVGVYYFAFNLSMQTLFLFAVNLEGVLFPALSKLQLEPARQLQAFLRAMRTLAAIGIPVCILQAVLARPVMIALFHSKWIDAIPVVQVLSVGMAFRIVGWPAQTLLQARGRFGTYCMLNVLGSVLFLIGVGIASARGQALAVSFVVAGYFAVEAPLTVFVAVRSLGGKWSDVMRIFVAPFLVGGMSVIGVGVIFEIALGARSATLVHQLVTVVGVSCVGLALYLLLVRFCARRSWGELTDAVNKLRRRTARVEA